MPTLEPITRGIRDGRHQHYPTVGIQPRPVATEEEAEEAAVRLLNAYHSISYLRLTDDGGAEIRDYRRWHFFLSDSPLRAVRQRVVNEDISARLAARS